MQLLLTTTTSQSRSSGRRIAVIKAFADRLPIRREFEPERGLSHARNRAVDAAKGDYIVWTDDDVVVAPGWLAAYIEAFRRWPEAAVFGGPIIPRYAPPVPKWLIGGEVLLHEVLSFRDFGDADLPLSIPDKRLPFGPASPSAPWSSGRIVIKQASVTARASSGGAKK